jgi:hypothetical protein
VAAAKSTPGLRAIVALGDADPGAGYVHLMSRLPRDDGPLDGPPAPGDIAALFHTGGTFVRGRVSGVVCGQSIALQSFCHVEADMHHMSLAIEQGAHFHGHSRRARSEADLVAVLDERNTVPATTND